MAEDVFDYGVKRAGGLTGLRCRLKEPSEGRDEAALPRQFTLTLYSQGL